MKAAIVIPGIMGTRLYIPAADGDDREEVWPPTPAEVVFGYNRIDKLQRDDLEVGEIIDNVICYDFYKLLDDHLSGLGYSTQSSTKRQVNFAYDWRQDNIKTADLLAKNLDVLHSEGAEEIFLLAHSMGGLVARLMLESGKFNSRPWFSSIRLLATFGTPHHGAALALARIFGLDAANGISKNDFATLSANRKYPSGYQLIPAPGEAAIWNLKGNNVVPLDPYDSAVSAELGLDAQLIDEARAIHNVLSAGNQPDNIRYAYFAGSGHRTVTRVNVIHSPGSQVDHNHSNLTQTEAAGDGTVPLYSALPNKGFRQIVVNEHATVFKGQAFRKVLYRLFGEDAGSPLEAAPQSTLIEKPYLQLSLERQVYEEGDTAELLITIMDPYREQGQIDNIEGKLVIRKLNEQEESEISVLEIPVNITALPISTLSLILPELPDPGLYQIIFEGNPVSEAPVPFAVRKANP